MLEEGPWDNALCCSIRQQNQFPFLYPNAIKPIIAQVQRWCAGRWRHLAADGCTAFEFTRYRI